LLLHNAGFPPDPVPDFWDPAFGCPEAAHSPPAETFSCSARAFTDGILGMELLNPVGAKYVYSDLSMITMMYVVGRVVHDHGLVPPGSLLPHCMAGGVAATAPGTAAAAAAAFEPWQAQCYYEAFVRTAVFAPVGITRGGFLPAPAQWPAVAPACVGTAYRACPMQGTVSDGNSYALGGVAGHAGVFATAAELGGLARALLFAPPAAAGPRPGGLQVNATTVGLFTKMHNRTQSSRALGWDTNDYAANHYRGCGNLSSLSFTHTGYTGTEICADPERGLITVLLTNRCFPDDSGASKSAIHAARQGFNNAVKDAVDSAAAAQAQV
jgi:hypothetical protein